MFRVDAGTDIGLVGMWDKSRDEKPLNKNEVNFLEKISEIDSIEGNVFFIKAHADGGGPIDFYVDEDIPEEVKKEFKEIDKLFHISIPSGKLIVGGMEDYRTESPKTTGENSVVTIPRGEYSLKCYVGKDKDEYHDGNPESELLKVVETEDLKYFDRINLWGLVIGVVFSLLLFAILLKWLSWKISLPISFIGFLSYFHIFEWMIKKNERYQRLNEIIPKHRIENPPPTFVFALKPIDEVGNLKGGFVEL